ncbi:type I secretion system permease/ATPase [Shewanella sp. 1_MG-2023]|uniref:type I secretion system permease/ATPase n=1 Tax=unclassified Shewanella TaxID=196818 RepID=UPI0026E24582|nr:MULTISPECIES: type I secretion system permease/ATPase [unclassified Shewanella]MDO6613031.1 type I secretion system permease/ATPase [Shewanella sp. 7_MG-2023]MDO6772899.1 type I secretion system permease/ATPase [Shewanella sp. 2_MG-2023]MDO6796647.1 type I secretion system permease/ATPase [Shewanella sp. 1_MG-2023]
MDSGLHSLVAIARFHQLPAEPEQISHEFGQPGKLFSDTDILLAAKALTLKAKKLTLSITELNNSVLPAIAKDRDGHYFIIARLPSDKLKDTNSAVVAPDGEPEKKQSILIHDLNHGSPQSISVDELKQRWSGELIALVRRQGFGESLQQKFDISWFIPSLVKYRKLFGEVLVASFFLQIFALVIPLFFQVVMDKVLVHRGFTTLDVLAVGFFVVVVFEAILGGIRNYTFSHTTNRVDVELGSRLFQHLLNLPLSYFESRQVGQNVARVRELDTIRNFITGTALTLVIDLLFVFVFLAVMWYYSPTLTWIVLASIPFYIILSVFITPILRRRLDEKFKHGAANTAFLTESITGIGTVKSMAVEPQMRRKLEDHLSSYVHASFKSQNLGNVAGQIAGLINKLVTLGIIWVGAHLVIDGAITVGQLVAFNMLAGRVSGPILKLVQLWQDFQQAGISIERLGDILNTPKEPGFNPNRSRLPSLQGAITLEHVRFRYRPDGPVILNEINLQTRPGEVIGIVGRSGSGKSTITKLVQRLYIPESGRVLVDGVDLSMIDTAWLRKQIGVVLQENFLFNRTVRENIALSDPAISMERVVAAAKMAGAHEFIVELPEGYDNIVGEQGSNLSGGQRQRLAIARALISNPRILIFDEATSALDYESERLVQDNMARICKGRTVFIIAHRLTTVRQCDRIIVMDKGRIVEQGSHDNLVDLNGYYAKLYSYQSHTPNLHPVKHNQPNYAQTQQGGAKVNNLASTHSSVNTSQAEDKL